MNLIETPEMLAWPETHYVFVEKTGPFMETAPACWAELHQSLPKVLEGGELNNFLSLYKVKPEMLYRAGVSFKAKPKNVPQGFQYELFPGGNYAKFTYTGPYEQLGPVSGRVHQLAAEKNLKLRDGFFIENYVNNPKDTAPEKLITEILVPVV